MDYQLPTVTYDQVIAMEPCWLNDDKGRRRLKRYADRLGGKATAIDILRLNRVPVDDRLWLVLRSDFMPDVVLHEFACRCADRALARIDNPDPRSVAAIAAKRAWIAGEIGADDLAAAWAAARAAAARVAERQWQIDELLRMLGG